MKHLFICTFVILTLGVGFYGCDSTTSPNDPITDNPYIAELSVSPQDVEFTLEEDGFKDTTLTLDLFVRVANFSESPVPGFTITNKNNNEVVSEGEFEFLDSRRFNYTAKAEINTTTTSFEDYIINAFVIGDHGNLNYAQTTFSISGFSNSPPEILKTESPEEIQRPASGEVPAIFKAKVTDKDGQETIDKVFIRVINQESGEVQGSPFEMFDDGSTYNDEVANDSTYTWLQLVTNTNENPNRDFDIEFFAVDVAGLSSDTVRTTFRIRE